MTTAYEGMAELRTELVHWMRSQDMIGDYAIHFRNNNRVYGNLYDPKGPRWVHIFIQDEENRLRFEYNVAPVDDNMPAYITVVDKNAELEQAALFEERQKLVNVIANRPTVWVDEARALGVRLTRVPIAIKEIVAEQIVTGMADATRKSVGKERYLFDLKYHKERVRHDED